MNQELDEKQALLYGQFVEAAYTMFDHPQGGDPLRPEPAGIPDGYELGAWIHMSDFVLSLTEVKFYGIVAHSVSDPDTRVIAIRGTEGAVEWLDDAAALLVPFRQVPSAGRVADGFDKIYSSLKVVKRPLPKPEGQKEAPQAVAAAGPETFEGSFAEQLDQLATSREAERGEAPPAGDARGRRQRPTVVAGHSLGAALATLFVMENDAKRRFDIQSLYTFASPRVGNMEFVGLFNQLVIDSWRVVNKHDVVPKIPIRVPELFDYGHVDTLWQFDSSSWANRNLSCFHTLETYLHALDASSPLSAACVPKPAAAETGFAGSFVSKVEKLFGKGGQ